jgi:hypothetical protein
MVLVMAWSVHAIPSPIIAVTGCGFGDANTVTCGGFINATYVSCNVVDTWSGSPPEVITGVTFTINGLEYSTTVPVSGSTVNGVWNVSLDAGAARGQSTMRLEKVVVRESTGQRTGTFVIANGLTQQAPACGVYSSGCYFNATGILSVPVSCTCADTVTTVCANNNVATVTHTPTVGCADQTVTTQTTSCDYCNPQFTVEYGVCTPSGYATDASLGLHVKHYVAANPSCCVMTNLSSDCSAAPGSGAGISDDGATTQCRLGSWIQSGNVAEGTNREDVITTVTRDVPIDQSVGVSVGYPFKPLVMDWQGLGLNTILIQTGNGHAVVYNALNLSNVLFDVNTGGTWSGQVGTFGFSKANGITRRAS